MRFVLLFLIACPSVFAQDYKVVGYSCPTGYYFRADSGLCQLTGSQGEQVLDSPNHGKPLTVRRRIGLDKKKIMELLNGEYFKEEPIENE